MSSRRLPVLAVTLGDPAGIGPEITARTLADPQTADLGHGIAVGDAAVLRRAVQVCGLDVEVNAVGSVAEARFTPGTVDVLDLGIAGDDLEWGEVSAVAGRSAVAAIEAATRAALAREVDGIVTSPINKEAVWAAGAQHLGHTEMLGELTGAAHFDTMFVVRGLKIFFTTRHVSLRKALDQIDEERVAASIRHATTALRVFGHDEPRLGVAAINPHGGENGHFGDEEITALRPAVERTAAEGLDVTGPVPADSVFHQGLQGRFDGVLSHFHDQGHIPAKTVDFDGTVSVTVGLPILRTSVDHGTAFDIAGTGKASPGTMAAAFRSGVHFSAFTDRIRAAYGTGA
ncbi:4-hydroxythreonine-4-phosphate dehydrogenase [Streptomyces abyssalis]|uniref:4-hydroxythreonine-4-phosphate dehydrogenase n=1 Tax=Streptomyces abyssalis TaxID=933944 RepID=A0A1E7JHL1_9ACTN|nr:4-hydroxythreonine-4-phosphate dehydrogenase PdxA [Streptomyces abyssalis]OEU85937.1 4-hydroxythreonine-4-phosphate dehydrogenase [Streptomyces abyssalis]OEU92595.1 4-hydroxythreonine-4-phosphate dehydrogenase [Streptomyces abyssalis]OEV29331.1 4-hydroxythreonine-4-phosphate dehydrogenase [Streptomyces nanshensis]